MLANPRPALSRFLFDGVTVRSSTSFAVSSDSIRPTKAILSAQGQIIVSVCRFSGTNSCVSPGSPPLIAPSSPTVGSNCLVVAVNSVNKTMAISGAGMLLITRGTHNTMSSVKANSPQMSGLLLQKWGTWAKKIRIPRAFTNPVMTAAGIKRIRRAIPVKPNRIWINPANTTAGRMYCTPCWCTIGPITSATEPAAAVTIAGRPPMKDIARQSTTEAIRLTFGSTPAITEKEITSGISASAVITPASVSRTSRRGARRTPLTVCSAARAGDEGVTDIFTLRSERA